MKRFALALAFTLAPAFALAQGYLNPPIYATGTIFAVTGVTGSTSTPIKNAANPNNLNIYNRTAMSGTWTITMPFPAFDAQIINWGCPGGDVPVVDLQTVSGSGDSIGAGGPTTCTASDHSLAMYQFQLESHTWKFITLTSGGETPAGCTNCVLVETGTSTKISNMTTTGRPLDDSPGDFIPGIQNDEDDNPANVKFDRFGLVGPSLYNWTVPTTAIGDVAPVDLTGKEFRTIIAARNSDQNFNLASVLTYCKAIPNTTTAGYFTFISEPFGNTITIHPFTGQNIRWGSHVGDVDGTLFTNVPGSTITLFASCGSWFVLSYTGTWTLLVSGVPFTGTVLP